ncbi:MAG TPA: glycosyltransferase family 39 protein [Lacipirellula sp.]
MDAREANRASDAAYRWGLALALALAFALRAYDLQGQSLFSDEIIETSIARLPVEQIVRYPDGFPPLYHLALAAWTRVFPAPEMGRWLSVLIGVATVYAVGRWGRGSVGPLAGIFAAGLVAVSPMHIYFSQELRAYALYIGAASFAMMYFFEGVRTDSAKSWAGFVIASAAAVNTHYYAAMLAGLLGLLLLVYRPRWREMRRGIGAFLALAICSLPALVLLPGDVAYQSEGFAGRAPLLATLWHTAYAFFAGFSLGPSLSELHELPMREAARMAAPWVAAFAVTGAILLWHGWQELRRRPYGYGIIFLAVASAPIIGVAGAAADVGPKVRYWSWILMPLVVWLAAGAARGWHGRGRWLTRTAFGVLVGLQLLAVINRYDNPRYANEDIRAVARYLQRHAEADEPIFVVADYMAPPLRYYLNGQRTLDGWLPHAHPDGDTSYATSTGDVANKRLVHPRTEADVRGSAPFDEAAIEEWSATVRELAGEKGRFWVVYTRAFHGDRDGALLRFLQDDGWIKLDREFPGVKLYRGWIQ